MQPIYVTLTSTGTTPWKTVNWNCVPQQISFAVISTGGSSWLLESCFEDPSGTYPSPISSAPTPFTMLQGSANATVGVGPGSTNSGDNVIAGYRFTLNTQSSAGARVTLVVNQAGIG